MIRAARCLLIAIGVVVASAVPVAAHADPVSMSPATCATVSEAREVQMDFTEELEVMGSRLEVYSDGTLIASAGPDLSDLDRVTMVAALPEGTHGVVEVEWTSVSALDDDAASGRYAFTVGETVEGVDCDSGDGEESGSNTSLVVILGLTAVVGAGIVGVAHRPARIEG